MSQRSDELMRKLSAQSKVANQAEKRRDKAVEQALEEKTRRKEAEQSAVNAHRQVKKARKQADALRRRAVDKQKEADAERHATSRAREKIGKLVSSDGRRLHQVEVASHAQGGKRMALDEVHTKVQGSLKTRAGSLGGLEYRKEELVSAFANEVRAGIAGREEMGLREEENMLRRARAEGAVVNVLQTPRSGAKTRRLAPEGPVQAFPRPCNSTMAIARTFFRNLLHFKAREIMQTAQTIVLMTDGKSFKARHACGVLLCAYSMEPGEETDAFGFCPEKRKVMRCPLQLQMQANKLVRKLFDRDGNQYVQQTPFHVIRALELAGLGSVVREFRHKLCITADAAADNRGCGNFKVTMDNMSGKQSLLENGLVNECAALAVDEDLKRREIRDILIQFN
jgi:hypothetical protein